MNETTSRTREEIITALREILEATRLLTLATVSPDGHALAGVPDGHALAGDPSNRVPTERVATLGAVNCNVGADSLWELIG